MRARSLLLSGFTCAIFMSGAPATASETTSFTYDALGRLTATKRTGGPSNGANMATCFDPAGNRLRYDVTIAAPTSCSTPPPTPRSTNLSSETDTNAFSIHSQPSGRTNLQTNDSATEG